MICFSVHRNVQELRLQFLSDIVQFVSQRIRRFDRFFCLIVRIISVTFICLNLFLCLLFFFVALTVFNCHWNFNDYEKKLTTNLPDDLFTITICSRHSKRLKWIRTIAMERVTSGRNCRWLYVTLWLPVLLLHVNTVATTRGRGSKPPCLPLTTDVPSHASTMT